MPEQLSPSAREARQLNPNTRRTLEERLKYSTGLRDHNTPGGHLRTGEPQDSSNSNYRERIAQKQTEGQCCADRAARTPLASEVSQGRTPDPSLHTTRRAYSLRSELEKTKGCLKKLSGMPQKTCSRFRVRCKSKINSWTARNQVPTISDGSTLEDKPTGEARTSIQRGEADGSENMTQERDAGTYPIIDAIGSSTGSRQSNDIEMPYEPACPNLESEALTDTTNSEQQDAGGLNTLSELCRDSKNLSNVDTQVNNSSIDQVESPVLKAPDTTDITTPVQALSEDQQEDFGLAGPHAHGKFGCVGGNALHHEDEAAKSIPSTENETQLEHTGKENLDSQNEDKITPANPNDEIPTELRAEQAAENGSKFGNSGDGTSDSDNKYQCKSRSQAQESVDEHGTIMRDFGQTTSDCGLSESERRAKVNKWRKSRGMTSIQQWEHSSQGQYRQVNELPEEIDSEAVNSIPAEPQSPVNGSQQEHEISELQELFSDGILPPVDLDQSEQVAVRIDEAMNLAMNYACVQILSMKKKKKDAGELGASKTTPREVRRLKTVASDGQQYAYNS
ncbi:hypothetical protein BP6252_07900 [Coleophoma cylindrospora]|uniref:Uncharacterized protein n=1 Tax=Coleophoma cylindrospora TaxID=1849047 RepID=A0A3D8RBB4_9HELO|nr:hypothetical protein BP6252_07900 [Coleophoma cylindrospora]